MQFKFIGNPHRRDDRGELTMFGITFPLNIPVDVEHPGAIKKLMANAHFSMIDGGIEHFQKAPAKLIVPGFDVQEANPDKATKAKKIRV